jgi:hypothetical protein
MTTFYIDKSYRSAYRLSTISPPCTTPAALESKISSKAFSVSCLKNKSLVLSRLRVELESGKQLWRFEWKQLKWKEFRSVYKHHESGKVFFSPQKKKNGLDVLGPTADIHMYTFCACRMFLGLLKSSRILAIDVSRSNVFIFMYILFMWRIRRPLFRNIACWIMCVP